MITADEDRAFFERRGAEAGEQDNILECRCGEFYVEGEYHRCRRSDGVG